MEAINSDKNIKVTVRHTDSSEDAFIATRDVLKNTEPDVIFSMSDEILTGAMKAIQKKGLKIPSDVAVISVSNDGFIPRLYEPEITYIETSGYKLGKLAFQRIQDHMNGKHFYKELISPALLVPGGSL